MQQLNSNIFRQKNKEGFYNRNISDLAFYLLVGMVWINSILMTYVRAVITRLPIFGNFGDEVIIFIYIVVTVLAIPAILKKIQLKDLFVYLAPLVICIITVLVYPYNIEKYIEYMPNFLFACLPVFFLGVAVDWEKSYKMLYYLSLLTIVLRFIYSITLEKPMTDVESMYEGDMWSSYLLLPHVCLVGLEMFKKPNILNIGSFLLGVVVIFSLGSRGPLLCLLSAVLLYLIFLKKYKHPFITRIGFVAVGIFLVIAFENIMHILSDVAKDLGMSVRVFELYESGDFFVSKGRDFIKEDLYELIAAKPLLGYGLYGDRINIDIYAHSLYLELWISFGIVLGTAIFGALIIFFIKTVKKIDLNSNIVLIILSLFCASFLKLFLSGSFLDEANLYLLIGICVAVLRNKNITQKTETFCYENCPD